MTYLIYSWVLPLLVKGRKKVLGLEDLYQPLEQHKAINLGTNIEKAWEAELVKKRAQNKSPSLMKAGLKVFGGELSMYGIFLLLIEMCLKVTSPFLLGKETDFYFIATHLNLLMSNRWNHQILRKSSRKQFQ